MTTPIDEIDHQILARLQADARTPLAAIAKEVGLSGAAISERVRKLEQTGVIRGYTVLVDREKLGKPLTAFIRVTVAASRGGDQTATAAMYGLAAEPDVLEIHHVAGEDCYILKVRAPDPRGLEALLARLWAQVDVARTITMIVLSTIKEDQRVVERWSRPEQ